MLHTDSVVVQVAYGDALVAAGLAATLRQVGDVVVVTDTSNGDARSGGASSLADVVIADYERGLSLLAARRSDARARRGWTGAVLILSHRDTESEIRHALEQGARGYLILGCCVDELLAAVRTLRAGARYMGAKAAQRLADSLAFEALTAREVAVLRLLVAGLGNKVIASRLDIAIGTVKSHLKSIFQKLNAASRTEVAAVAERRGLLAVPRTASEPSAGPAHRVGGRQTAGIRAAAL